MYDFQLSSPASVADAVAGARRPTDARLLAGGQTLIPTLKQRLAQPSDAHRSRRHRRAQGHQPRGGTLVIGAHDPARRGRAAPRCKAAIPALADLAGGIGDPAGAQPRHDRRLDRQQRPGGRLSRGGAGARRDDRHQQARDPGRRLLHRHVRDGAASRARSSPAVRFPMPEKAGYAKFAQPASRYAWSACSSRRPGRRALRGDRLPAPMACSARARSRRR